MYDKQNTLKLKFSVPEDFLVGISRLSGIFGYEEGEDIEVFAHKGERLGVSLRDGVATVFYRTKPEFFRELGILCKNARESSQFEIEEDGFFEKLGFMLDISRTAAPKNETIYEFVDYAVAMGYGMLMLYIEDVIKLESRPYFGYLRGRYTVEEIRAIDDYAHEYGIEVVPSIECYGHMAKYLAWPEAGRIRDTASVLLAREPKTFEFLDELIRTVSSGVRTKRIHLGMDEAWDMGRGAFLDRHGYVPPIDIFNEFMTELVKITDKYSLSPMMWSDMYFRAETKNNAYYDEDTVVSEKTKKSIPENMSLVFWHYGEEPKCDEYMLKKHTELNRNVIFAGGVWSWAGAFPDHKYGMESTQFSLNSCRKCGVREAMTTVWGDDNNECPLFANLFGLSYTAEMAFGKEPSTEKLKERFEFVTGGDYGAFLNMGEYNNIFDEDYVYETFGDRALGRLLYWQDILEGQYDTHLFLRAMSSHYASHAELMAEHKGGKWDYLYDFAYKVFDYLAIKCLIAENLVPAYKKKDKKILKEISLVLLPLLSEKTKALRDAHRGIWFSTLKTFGWVNFDIRYGGVIARCDSAKYLIDEYLAGRIDKIDSLEEERLYRRRTPFIRYCSISNPNLYV